MRKILKTMMALFMISSFTLLNFGEEFIIKPDPKTYTPPLTRGDTEFKGHGPRTTCTVKIYIRAERSVECSIYLMAKETKSNWTTFAGNCVFTLFSGPKYKEIVKILGKTSESQSYTDNDHSDDIFHMGKYGLVNKFEFVGDGKGKDRPSVKVYFNPIKLKLKDAPLGERKIAFYPEPITYNQIPRTKGDKDWAGNGPNVTVSVRIFKKIPARASRRDRIIYNIYFKARETKSDWTTVEGQKENILYKAPKGWSIKSITSPTMYSCNFLHNRGELTEYIDGSAGGLIGEINANTNAKGKTDTDHARVDVSFEKVSLILVEKRRKTKKGARKKPRKQIK